MTTRQLAAKLAKELFTEGGGRRARRLVMEQDQALNGSGWCESAVADRIEVLLKSLPAPRRGRANSPATARGGVTTRAKRQTGLCGAVQSQCRATEKEARTP